MKNVKHRKIILSIWLTAIFVCIGILFWHNEYIYSLPTPVPLKYHNVSVGEYVDLKSKLKIANSKPVFIHFFNPDCPCSRFNIPHVKSLMKKYRDKVIFTIVVINKNNNYSEEEIQDKFELNAHVLFDASIATACGVYSTPQAVFKYRSSALLSW